MMGSMKRIVAALVALTGLALAAPPEIFVAYPPNNYKVAFDRVLFEGSVPAGASFSINGQAVDVGTDGLFTEWLPLSPGLNVLKLETKLGGETGRREYRVTSSPPSAPPSAPTQIVEGSVEPAEDGIFYSPAGQTIFVRMRGSRGGEASFKVGDKGPFPMVERKPEDYPGLGDPGGPSAVLATAGVYEGFYQVTPEDRFEGATIQVGLEGADGNTVTADAPGELTVRDGNSRVGIFTGNPLVGISSGNDVARNAPGRAYVLYPRQGTKFAVTGEVGDTYQASLTRGQTVYLRKDRMRLLPEGAPLPQAFFARIETRRVEGATQIRYLLPEIVPFDIEQDSSSLELRLFYTSSDVDYVVFANPDPIVRDIRWNQEQDGVFKTRISLKLAQQWGYKAFYEGSTFVLQLRDPPKINPSRPLEGRKITIDPGHGGSENGGAGSLRVPEKNLTLKISLLLAEILRGKGVTVTLTRDKDVRVDLFERSGIADRAGSEVLVSVHANALPDGVDPKTSRGIGVYYFQPQSRPLAEAVQSAMIGLMPEVGDDGVHYQNLALTRPTGRPQILVETAFLTDKGNLRFLMSEAGQQQMAEGIAAGLEQFFKTAK